jgi:hypothetical protein
MNAPVKIMVFSLNVPMMFVLKTESIHSISPGIYSAQKATPASDAMIHLPILPIIINHMNREILVKEFGMNAPIPKIAKAAM